MNNAEQFTDFCNGLSLLTNRLIFVCEGAKLGGSTTETLFVNFINLPPGRDYCGAEKENNRTSFKVSGDFSGKVKIEQLVSVFPRARNMRAKTASPEKVSQYLSDYLRSLIADVAPNYTHSK